MESIVKFFSRYYNFVKTFKKYYKDSEKVEIFDKIFEKYKDQIQTFLKKYNLEERFIQAIDNDAPADIIFIFVELIINALRDNDLRKFLLEMWITSVRHFEELIPNLVIPILDPDVYYEIKSLIEEAASVDAESVIKVLWSYFRIISEKPTILDINSSLLVNKEKNPEELWIFFIIYQVDVVSLSKDKVLELPFPFIKNGDVKWLKLGDIKEIKLISYQGNWTYQIENGYILKPTKKIISWLNFLELNFLCYIITKFIKIDFNKTDQFPEVSLNLETLPTNEYKPEYGRFYVVPFNKNSILTLEWIQYDSGRYWGVFNSNHSISEIVSRISYKPYENLSDKEKFCQSIVSLLRAPWFYSYYKNKKKPTNNMKYIAHLYVHLINIEKDLENIIPFNVFIKDIGIIEVNDKLLRSWL